MIMVFVLLLCYLCLLVYIVVLLDTMKWLEMIIYLVCCLWLIMCHSTSKCSHDFICDLNYYVLCILLHSRLHLIIFRKLQDSPGNTTLLEDFSHPIFLVFPDS